MKLKQNWTQRYIVTPALLGLLVGYILSATDVFADDPPNDVEWDASIESLLSWAKPTQYSNGAQIGDDIGGYLVSQGTESGVYTRTHEILDPDQIMLIIRHAITEDVTTYYFVIQAFDKDMNYSAYSQEISKTYQVVFEDSRVPKTQVLGVEGVNPECTTDTPGVTCAIVVQ